jgi:hypothetical protein
MDRQAKDQLRQQLFDDPPEATTENIYATLQQFIRDAGVIFRAAERSESEWGDQGRLTYTHCPSVDCVEVQPHLAEALRNEGIYRSVRGCDFLLLKPDPANLYDRVVMNPPFDRERDIDHVMHALSFLKLDGFLIAIMSAGTEFRETRKATRSAP